MGNLRSRYSRLKQILYTNFACNFKMLHQMANGVKYEQDMFERL